MEDWPVAKHATMGQQDNPQMLLGPDGSMQRVFGAGMENGSEEPPETFRRYSDVSPHIPRRVTRRPLLPVAGDNGMVLR